MRILCVSQNLPAETEPLALVYATAPGNEVLSASQQKRAAKYPTISRMFLRKCDAAKFEKNYFGFWRLALRVSQDATSAFAVAMQKGFAPDIILSCSSNGAGFALRQTFPDAFIVCLADSKLELLKLRGKELYAARAAIQRKQFGEANLTFINFASRGAALCGHTPEIAPPAVDADFFRPGPNRSECKTVTLLAGGLRHSEIVWTWRLCQALLQKDAAIKLQILCENSLRDFPWREAIAAAKLDNRIRLEYWPGCCEWLDALQQTTAAVCVNADIPVCGRLLEAMSCEKTIIVVKNSLPFLKPGVNCLALPASRAVSFLLDVAKKDQTSAGIRARQDVLEHYDQKRILPGVMKRISGEYEKWLKSRAI